MVDEKRSSKRIYRRFILRAAAFGEQPLVWSYVTIHNLSATGAFFTFDRPVHIGDLLHFKIDFPDRVIECVGRIRRLAGAQDKKNRDVGASFEGIRPQDKRYIDAYVEKNGGI